MADSFTFALTTVAVGVAALVHAVFTWPLDATVALFVGGAAVAFVAEAVAIGLGWLEHHIGPKLLGVPLYVLLGWTGVIYVVFRVGLLVTDGAAAVAVAALLATGYDLLADHHGVEDGHWTYTDDLPGPRRRGVPWWNYAGWTVISAVTAGLALPLL
ncbi:carotenoid biosynthesis protein [Halorussus sp. MSC15.2]|uniref:carotenoid biosynthesis protein n=1 Tax=Halorussus sp. MSC15.2 TaxID=2283638 RepID=UPI0013D6C853|nr:carotenoid biosynthesis protein [Halorussus sp. MSC15.2]NEU55843.1 carotenoid biosynthesis protein [Halorussus sp. MSC15.2]